MTAANVINTNKGEAAEKIRGNIKERMIEANDAGVGFLRFYAGKYRRYIKGAFPPAKDGAKHCSSFAHRDHLALNAA